MHTGILNFTVEVERLSPGSVGTRSCTILFCPVKSKYSGAVDVKMEAKWSSALPATQTPFVLNVSL